MVGHGLVAVVAKLIACAAVVAGRASAAVDVSALTGSGIDNLLAALADLEMLAIELRIEARRWMSEAPEATRLAAELAGGVLSPLQIGESPLALGLVCRDVALRVCWQLVPGASLEELAFP